MNKNLTIIDLDSITYIIAYKQFKEYNNLTDIKAVKEHVKEFIDTIVLRTDADFYALIFQAEKHKNFRNYYYPDYKNNRPESPEFIDVWRKTIHEKYIEMGATPVYNIESDDVLCIGEQKYRSVNNVTLAHADKDMYQIACNHWNFKKSLDEAFKNINTVNAYYNWAIQMITGDSTDGIKGIPGLGPSKASKLLEATENISNYIDIIQLAYKNKFNDTWFSEYKKTEMLITLLKEIPNKKPFKEDINFKFNIMPNKINTASSLFEVNHE